MAVDATMVSNAGVFFAKNPGASVASAAQWLAANTDASPQEAQAAATLAAPQPFYKKIPWWGWLALGYVVGMKILRRK